jgi:RNA polymerase sigma factor (sigma-70 family)
VGGSDGPDGSGERGSAEAAVAAAAVDPVDPDPVAEAFEAQRDRLRAVAHRMLGSHADAEDVVQEAWLRLSHQDVTTIHNLVAWQTTVVGRISLDILRARRARPEASYDDRLTDLLVTLDDGPAPDEDAALADSVGLALLVVLDSLGPSERLAFVLHDLFAVPFAEIAQILGKSTAAAKMLASRARRKVRATERSPVSGATGDAVAAGAAGRAGASGGEQRAVVDAFLAAARHGDFEGLLRVLDPDVRLTADTPGGVVVTLGATAVAAGARLSAGAAARGRAVLVNRRPGIMWWREDGVPLALMTFTVVEDRITEIALVVDPGRLASLDLPEPEPGRNRSYGPRRDVPVDVTRRHPTSPDVTRRRPASPRDLPVEAHPVLPGAVVVLVHGHAVDLIVAGLGREPHGAVERDGAPVRRRGDRANVGAPGLGGTPEEGRVEIAGHALPPRISGSTPTKWM